MAVTIKEIAEKAGVSRATADKVLNNRAGVKSTTRERVLAVAAELQYKPNILGKSLVRMNKEPLKLGVILTPDFNPYIQKNLEGIHRAATEFREFGISVIPQTLTSLNPDEQLAILNNMIQQNYAGIGIFPMDDTRIVNRINEAATAGTAIVTFNSEVQGIEQLCFIGQNHYRGGRTVASLFNKILPQGGDVAVIISSKHLSCHQDRLRGFQEKLAIAAPGLNIVAVEENQDRVDEAYRITAEYCERFPDLKGIYVTGGGITGVVQALQAADYHRIKLICHDLILDTYVLLQAGILDFVLDQSPEEQGYQIVKTLFEYVVKGTRPKRVRQEIPVVIATDECNGSIFGFEN